MIATLVLEHRSAFYWEMGTALGDVKDKNIETEQLEEKMWISCREIYGFLESSDENIFGGLGIIVFRFTPGNPRYCDRQVLYLLYYVFVLIIQLPLSTNKEIPRE